MKIKNIIKGASALWLAACLSACSILTPWEPYPKLKDLPLSNGKPLISQIKRVDCIMCTTGFLSETRLKSVDGDKYSPDDLFLLAEGALKADLASDRWVLIKEDRPAGGWRFSSQRIFLPSVEPLVVLTAPWQYKTRPNTYRAATYLRDEMYQFAERIEFRDYYDICWQNHQVNIVELRSSLPKEIGTVTIWHEGESQTITLPTEVGESKTVVMRDAEITFTRRDKTYVNTIRGAGR